MHELHELKEMLCEELKEYGSKDKMDVGGLEIVDKLAHAIKNIDKIIEAYDDSEYSMMGGNSYADGNRRYYNNRSYARRRDSMGRYSRAGEEMVTELRELMEEAPNDHIKQEFRKLIQKIEQM